MPNVHTHENEIAAEHKSKWKYAGTITFLPHGAKIRFKCERYEIIPRHAGKNHDEIKLFNAVTSYHDGQGKAREFIHHHADEVTWGGVETTWSISGI